jgi:hypothetical protein
MLDSMRMLLVTGCGAIVVSELHVCMCMCMCMCMQVCTGLALFASLFSRCVVPPLAGSSSRRAPSMSRAN